MDTNFVLQGKELLEFRLEEGRILLKDIRMLLINAQAMGTLRKDLISTLGQERAKGFLTRYGWSCGSTDAYNLMGRWPEKGPDDWSFLGAAFHTLEGIARVRPVKVQSNPVKGTWYFEGIWENSYEAEQHMLHFGKSTIPVCWSLTGYAGGFRSACLGKRVIYKEVECVGKGDPHCRFIGKTLEEWGDEITTELTYYEEAKIGEALDQAHRHIARQHRLLSQSVDSHDRLTKMVLDGAGIEAIARTLGDLLGCGVLLQDRYFQTLVHYFPTRELVLLGRGAFPGSSLKGYSTDPEYRSAWQYLCQSKRPVELSHPNAPEILLAPGVQNQPWVVVAPVVMGGEILAYVGVCKPRHEVEDLDLMTLERAASVFALEMLKDRTAVEVQEKIAGGFVEDLISGNFTHRDEMLERARHLGYGLTANCQYYTLIIELDDFSNVVRKLKSQEPKILAFKQELLDLARSSAAKVCRESLAAVKSNAIILLAGLPKEYVDPEAQLYLLGEEIKARLTELEQESPPSKPISVSVGIGTSCQQLEDFATSYNAARQALDIVRNFGKEGQVVSLNKLGAYSILFNAINKDELVAFAHRSLGPLASYDQKHRAQLLRTLEVFLEQDCHLQKTSEAAAVSVSGLKYRLQRIKEIANLDLGNAQERFNIHLALKIMRMANLL